MREILFRGKDLESGEWVEGVYFPQNDTYPATIFCGNHHSIGHYVDVNTVGQYTGMTDKNGKKIFEGDIIRTITFGFDKEMFVTDIRFDKVSFRLGNGRNIFYFGQTDWTKMSDSEVIGNIHDNPEPPKE